MNLAFCFGDCLVYVQDLLFNRIRYLKMVVHNMFDAMHVPMRMRVPVPMTVFAFFFAVVFHFHMGSGNPALFCFLGSIDNTWNTKLVQLVYRFVHITGQFC